MYIYIYIPPPPPWGPGGGGRPQRVPDKLIKYKEKTEMRETTGNPDLTGNLQSFARFRRKPKMIPRSIRAFW